MVALLSALIPEIPPHVSRIFRIGVAYKFIKRSSVPQVYTSVSSRANIFGTSYELDALQYNRLKNYHTPIVPLPTLYDVDLHRDIQDKPFTNPDRKYIVELGGKTKKNHLACHLPSFSFLHPSG